MIELVMGVPGSGKTFYCTYRAYKAIKRGQMVFSNYPIVGAYKITFDDLINYTFPPNSLVIIDEAGRWFNSRKWGELPDQVFDLFTLHRHLKLDLLVAVQNFARIDKALREVVEIVWWADNRAYLPFFLYNAYYDPEMLGLKKESHATTIVSKFSRARKLYDTHIMSQMIDYNEIPKKLWFDKKDIKKDKKRLRRDKKYGIIDTNRKEVMKKWNLKTLRSGIAPKMYLKYLKQLYNLSRKRN